MSQTLETRFNQAMVGVYQRAKDEAGYTASIFLGMVYDKGGVDTAKYLINSTKPSDGYTALYSEDALT